MTIATKSFVTVTTFVVLLVIGFITFGPEESDPPPVRLLTTMVNGLVVPVSKTPAAQSQPITDPEWLVTVGADLKRAVVAIDPIDRKATAASRAQFEAAMAAGTLEVNTSSIGPPHWSLAAPRAIGFTINADLVKRRFRITLSPNVREGPGNARQQDGIPRQLWLNPGFRTLVVQVDSNGRFPVRIQRVRKGVMTLVTTVYVMAGPESSSEQFQLWRADDWQEGDTLRIPIDSPALLIERDAQTGAVIVPHMSGIEVGSGDSTPIPGAVMTW